MVGNLPGFDKGKLFERQKAKPSATSSWAIISSTSSALTKAVVRSEFLLAALGFLGFRQDVDVPAR